MASVLKIRNAPPKSATAATSAIVARKSAVDAARLATRSSGVDSVYGSDVSRRSSSPSTALTLAPGARPRSARVTAWVPKSAWADASGTTTVRPAGSGSPGTTARIPDTRNGRGPDSAEPFSVMVSPTPRDSACATALEMSATSPPATGSSDPLASGRSWSAGSAAGSTPITVTGAGAPFGSRGFGAG